MIDENVLNHPIFSDDKSEEKGFYENIMQHLADAGIAYPDFVEFEPAPEKHMISWSKTGGYTATGLDGTWKHLEELYDFIKGMGHDADFDESALTSPDVDQPNLGSDMVFLKPKKGKSSARLLLGAVDEKVLAYYQYYSFLRTAKSYIQNPGDFLLSYAFLEMHPAFWTRRDAEKNPYRWETSSGLSSVWIHPARDEKGKVVIMMEHGCSVPPHRTTRYHDPRLDIWTPTFENAYIQLASKVHTYFALDGSERQDIPYIKQAWEVEVEKRLTEFKKESDA